MPDDVEQTIEKVAWAVHRACGCDGCPPHQEDWQGSRDAFNQVITPLLAEARWEERDKWGALVDGLVAQAHREGAEQGWDEGAVAAAAYGRAYTFAYQTDSYWPTKPTNPYRAYKIAKGDDE